MKNRFKMLISGILSLAIALSMLPFGAVFAADLVSGASSVLTGAGGSLASGSYRLDDDIELENALCIESGVTADLYLNGKTLFGADNAPVITVKAGGCLNIYDTADISSESDFANSGVIAGGSGNPVCILNDEQLASGEYSAEDYTFSFGGALFVEENACVNIYGGVISGNTADYGSAVYSQGTVNIYNCLISGNEAGNSAAVYNEGTVLMDGTVKITDNVSNNGMGAVCNKGKLSLGGNIYITDNMGGGYCGGIANFGAEEDLVFTGGYYSIENNYIMGDTPADLLYSFWGTPIMFTVDGTIEEGSRIGLFGASEDFEHSIQLVRPAEGAEAPKQDLGEFFFSDDWNYIAYTDSEGFLAIKPENEIQLTAETPITENGIVFDKILSKRILKYYQPDNEYVYDLPEGNYILDEDIIFEEYTEGYELRINGNSSIYLNGNTIERVQGSSFNFFVIGEGTSLSICGDGTIKGFDSVAEVNGGSLTLNGGNIVENECFGYAVIVVRSGSFEMNGGYIGNNTFYNWSNAVYVDEGASFTMLGGKIADNNAGDDPCGVAVHGSVTLGGDALIYGNTYRNNSGYENVNTPANLLLYSEGSISVSEQKPLSSGAKIGITLNDGDWDTQYDGGDFLTSKKSVLEYFAADDVHLKLEEKTDASGKTLTLTPYELIDMNISSQYVKIGTKDAAFKVMCNPENLEGFKLYYRDLYDDEAEFAEGAPDTSKTCAYLVRIERDCDGVYAPLREYAVLRVGEECTISYDISSADSGTAPESLTGIEGEYSILALRGDIERFGYDFIGWEYAQEIYDEEDDIEFVESEMTVYPAWDLKLLQQPSKTNGYTVLVETTDPVSYQWQKQEKIVVDLSSEYIDSFYDEYDDYTQILNDSKYFNLELNYDLVSEGDSLSFDCDADLASYSENAGTLTRDGNHYTYTFNTKWCEVRIKNDVSNDDYLMTNMKLSCNVFKDVKGETANTLKNPSEGEIYRCLITYEGDKEKYTNEIHVVSFADVCEQDWFYKAVYGCTERNFLRASSIDAFGPFTSVTTEEFFYAIRYASNNSYWLDEADLSGFEEGKALTREEAARMLYMYEQYYGESFEGDWMFRLEYADLADISEEGYEAIAHLTMEGIVCGAEGYFYPQAQITRGEAAAMLMNFKSILQ